LEVLFSHLFTAYLVPQFLFSLHTSYKTTLSPLSRAFPCTAGGTTATSLTHACCHLSLLQPHHAASLLSLPHFSALSAFLHTLTTASPHRLCLYLTVSAAWISNRSGGVRFAFLPPLLPLMLSLSCTALLWVRTSALLFSRWLRLCAYGSPLMDSHGSLRCAGCARKQHIS